MKTQSKQEDIKLPLTTRSVPIALVRAREGLMAPIRDMLADSGITEQQWRVLRVLNELGPLEPTQVARHACLLMPSQTRIVQTLVQKGYVSRTAGVSDRRKQTLAITAAGRRIIARHAKQASEIAAKIEKRLGKQRLRDLFDILEDLNELT